jgi:hypothetical protein
VGKLITNTIKKLLICINKYIYLKKVDTKCISAQKLSFVLACFQASAAPRPENSDSDQKDALFGLDTQMTIFEF